MSRGAGATRVARRCDRRMPQDADGGAYRFCRSFSEAAGMSRRDEFLKEGMRRDRGGVDGGVAYA